MSINRNGSQFQRTRRSSTDVSQLSIHGTVFTRSTVEHPEIHKPIVCTNDDTVVGASHALKGMNICVPGDIRVTGIDDSFDATCTSPTISTVTQPHTTIARKVVS